MSSIDRRTLLSAGLGAAAAGTLAACSSGGSRPAASSGDAGARLVPAHGSAVTAAERKRPHTGRTRKVRMMAMPGRIDLGGRTVDTWAFDGRLPGRTIRATAGDTVEAQVMNHLPAETSVHWHGLALRNDMDGVPPVTQRAIGGGASFTYRFTAATPGTYWFHPHVGVQQDRGLYGALIVEDPHEPLHYDDEWVVVLDDWLDGVTGTPDQAFAELRRGMGGGKDKGKDGGHDMGDMGGMDMDMSAYATAGHGKGHGSDTGGGTRFMEMGARSALLGGDAGDVRYPYHLVNGRTADDPETFRGKPGSRLRIRIVNAGGDTAYRLALGGHRLTVTHTDGFPVRHETVDALLIGPGERYDVLATLHDGAFPLVAEAEGKGDAGRAVLRTGSGAAPSAKTRPKELTGRILPGTAFRAADAVRLDGRKPDRVHRIRLTGSMAKYDWGLNGRRFAMDRATAAPFTVRSGERVRVEFTNTTDMWHPMHLHGHTFQVGGGGTGGARKDTAIVLPGRTVRADFDADNPGRWLIHCHNAYHGEAGMMGLLGYLR